MRVDLRTLVFATALLASVTGIALAEGSVSKKEGMGQANARSDIGASTQSVGAGGLTGTGATKDGARTGASGSNPAADSSGSADTPSRDGSSAAPGTTR